MSFSRVIINVERRPTFKNVISMDLHCENKNHRLVITKEMGFKPYLNKIYVSRSKMNNFASCFEAQFSCEFFQLRE